MDNPDTSLFHLVARKAALPSPARKSREIIAVLPCSQFVQLRAHIRDVLHPNLTRDQPRPALQDTEAYEVVISEPQPRLKRYPYGEFLQESSAFLCVAEQSGPDGQLARAIAVQERLPHTRF